MTGQQIPVPGEIATKVCIGEVCLQWSRLEMTIIGLLCQIEPMETDKAYIMFGGLDILPRIAMAINLARHNKLPQPITKRISGIRAKLQGGLLDGRNQVVHGAHRDTDGAQTTLTMIRWKGDKRNRRISAVEIAQLASDIHDLGTEVWSISQDILQWSLVKHVKVNLGNALG